MALFRPKLGDLHLSLIRHPETVANVDRPHYKICADHAILPTEKGRQQSRAAGQFLASFVAMNRHPSFRHPEKVRVRYSPYYRTRIGALDILSAMGKTINHADSTLSYREDSLLFEQKAGLLDGYHKDEAALVFPAETGDYAKQELYAGKGYAQPPLGESRMDVYARARDIVGSIQRDYEKGFTHQVLMVHGVVLRVMVAAFLKYPPEWIEAEANPGNCWVRYIHGNPKSGYHDWGYVYGEGAPLRNPSATQFELKAKDPVPMLLPQRSREPLVRGVTYLDPFAYQ